MQAGLELAVLSPPSGCSDYKHVLPHLAENVSHFVFIIILMMMILLLVVVCVYTRMLDFKLQAIVSSLTRVPGPLLKLEKKKVTFLLPKKKKK